MKMTNESNATRGVSAAKIAAALSLLFWSTVIICGRWIGFTVR